MAALLALLLAASVPGCGEDAGDRSVDDDDENDERPRDAGAKKDAGSVGASRTLGGRLGATAANPCSPDSPCTDASTSNSDAGVARADGGGTSAEAGTAPRSDAGTAASVDGGQTRSDAGSTPRDAGGGAPDASTPGLDAGTTPAPMCRAEATDDVCDRCLKGKCCASLFTCAADTSCLDLAVCMDNCFDSSCLEACELLYPRAVDKYDDFTECAETSCLDACSASDDG